MFKIKSIKKSKIAAMATGAAVKIIIAVVCGALVLTGTYGVIKHTVLPNTKARTKALADYNGTDGAGGGDFADYVKYTDDFEDGPVQSYFYGSLENAIADANNNTTANALSDVTGAKAKIEVKEKDGGYIVKPIADCNIAATQTLSGNYIFDANGKTISLASGACLSLSGADITFRDSENGKIIKDVTSEVGERLIEISSASTAPSNVRFINGNYIVKKNGSAGLAAVYMIGTGLTQTCTTTIEGGNFSIESNSSKSGTTGLQLRGNVNISKAKITVKNTNSAATKASNGIMLLDTTGQINNCNINAYGGIATCAARTAGASYPSTVSLSGGTYTSTTENKKAYTIYGIRNISNANINAYVLNNNGKHEGKAWGILIEEAGNFSIKNCNIIADYNAEAGYEDLVCEGIKIHRVVNEAEIIGCNIKAVREALSLYGEKIKIIGGTYEGIHHGGAYFCSNKAIVKDATFKKWNYDGKFNKNNFYTNNAVFYVGTASNEVKVYMDNCKLENANRAVLSSNYNYKNTYLYASNTAFDNLRIDGANEQGNKGHAYLGKGATYKTTSSYKTALGVLDETTYKNVSFTPEYVAKNFN